jgi:hypothetical protein
VNRAERDAAATGHHPSGITSFGRRRDGVGPLRKAVDYRGILLGLNRGASTQRA